MIKFVATSSRWQKTDVFKSEKTDTRRKKRLETHHKKDETFGGTKGGIGKFDSQDNESPRIRDNPIF